MKLLLTALFATFTVLPAAFAAGDCDKCKKGEEKKAEGTLLAHCGKCEGDKDKDKKKEEKKEGTLIAHCGKCEGDKDKKKDEKKEGTMA